MGRDRCCGRHAVLYKLVGITLIAHALVILSGLSAICSVTMCIWYIDYIRTSWLAYTF